MKTQLRFCQRLVLGAALALMTVPAWPGVDLVGHDTDLFTTNPSIPSQVPNVLIVLDNTSNWSAANQGWTSVTDATCTAALGTSKDKQGDQELCALYKIILTLDEQINVGLMMFNDQNKGGYVRSAMKPMNATNKAAFLAALVSISTHGVNDPGEKTASNASYDNPINDAFRYFNSLGTSTGASGDRDSKADTSAYTSATQYSFLAGTADKSCGNDYIIWIGNTFPNSTTISPAIDNAAALLNDSSLVLNKTVLNTSGVDTDIWTRFLSNYGVQVQGATDSSGNPVKNVYRNITTYTIDVCHDHCDSGQATLLTSMAKYGLGKYFKATTLDQINTALQTVFAEVQAVNSVFAATSLPVSINVRGTNLNQVYIGVFRPDATLSPRWLGNLKQYKLGVANSATGQLELQDTNSITAVNLNTGFITNTATSIWTERTGLATDTTNTITTDGFWAFRSTWPNTDVGKDEDAPDGDLVEKGGAAQKIRQWYPSPDSTSAQTRNIYTCTGTCGTTGGTAAITLAQSTLSNYLFNSSNTDITAAKLGTFAGVTVTSITGSGSIATVTTSAAHGFVAGNSVAITGASPSYYNSSTGVAVLSSPAPTSTTFSYSISPTVVDTTHAYATYTTTVAPSTALVTARDKVTVTSSTPTAYNVATTTASDVSGASNQFSYPIASTTGVSSGYAVTAVRQLSSLVWASGGTVTATLLGNHGYSVGDAVTISGANDTLFNNSGTPWTVTVADPASPTVFKFNMASTPTNPAPNQTTGVVTLNGAVPASWGSGPSVLICGVTSANYNTASSGCVAGSTSATTRTATVCSTAGACPGVTPFGGAAVGNYFTYTTNATVSATASSLVGATIQRYVASDTSTFTVSSASVNSTTVSKNSSWVVSGSIGNATVGSGKNIFLVLNRGQFTTSGGSTRTLVAGDTLTMTNVCTYKVGGTTFNCPSSFAIAAVTGGNSAGGASGTVNTLADVTGTVTIEVPINLNAATYGGGSDTAKGATPLGTALTLTYSGSQTTNNSLRFTLSRGAFSGQILRQLAVNDVVTFANCTYSTGSSNNCTGPITAVSGNSSVTPNASTVAAGSYDNITGTVTVDVTPASIASVASVTVNATAAGSTPGGTATTIAYTGPTLSASITTATSPGISAIDIGPQSVTATGTIFAAKTGDLTSKISSITSQGVATGTISAALTTSADPNERANLINWVRGIDNKDDENVNGISTDIRAYVHGDVLHSRPAVVNYNRNGDDNDVYLFYGSNDGHLRAVKGGSLATGGGKEAWTFVAPEFFGKLKRQRDKSATISSSNPRDYFFDGPITIYTRDANKDSKLDATASGGANDKVYLFIGMRRGGRMYYALDVTDPLTPKLLWKRGCTEATGSGTTTGTGGCDTDWGELGQTWGEPKLGYLRRWPTTLALMFGAGNDDPVEIPQPCFITAWDSTSVTYNAGATVPSPMTTANCPASGTSTVKTRSMGRGVFIVNALTGDVLWRAGPDAAATKQVAQMNYAMVADLAVLRNSSNTGARVDDFGTESVTTGYIDRIYASDTGGNVWRVDVADATGTGATPPDFAVTRLASIAVAPVSGTHAALNYRKFLFSPDVVYTSTYDAVLLGSGDREHPFDQVVLNRFYMLKDFNISSIARSDVDQTNANLLLRWAPPNGTTITDSASGATTALFDVTSNCLQTASACAPTYASQAAAKAALAAAKGWKHQLDSNTGEKTIATATTAAGTVIFNTNQPKQDTVTGTGGSCTSDLGTARQYGESYLDGTATYIFSSLPSKFVPSGGRYAVFAGGGFLPQPVPVVVQIGGKYYQTVIAGVQTTNPGGLKLQSRVRTYWYRKVD